MKENINPLYKKSCDILLSTYNGEKFIKDQLDSILKQTYKNWKLIIRDDGSIDDTVNIIKEYTKKYPDKVIFIEDQDKHLGPCKSYNKLLQIATADYIFFCDQDDVWLSNKIELILKKASTIENHYRGTPLLIHTDLKVVDIKLNCISNSFWRYQRLNPNYKQLNNLIIQNNVTGCAMMINKDLRDLSVPISNKAIMHDWWIALVASAFGIIDYIKTPTVLYRQHEKNSIGAKKYSLGYFFKRFNKLQMSMLSNEKIIEQGKAFYERYKNQLTKSQKEMLYNFTTICEKTRFDRIYTLYKYKLKKYGVLRNIGFFMVMFLYNSKQ